MAMKLMKKAVPHTTAGSRKAEANICRIHTFPPILQDVQSMSVDF
jgi:hypothetical protein